LRKEPEIAAGCLAGNAAEQNELSGVASAIDDVGKKQFGAG